MSSLDYSGEQGDRYHESRHKNIREMLKNRTLLEAWGSYARRVYFPRLKAGDRVLEIGAGFGNNLFGVKDFAETLAVEPSKSAREHCESLGIKALSSFSEIDPGTRFHAILLRHVLEHVPEPRNLIVNLRSFLSAGGEMVIVLPTESPYKSAKVYDRDHHLYCWNRQTITNFLEDAGCRVLESKVQWSNGRKFFLPLYPLFGTAVYGWAMGGLGRLRRISELIVFATGKEIP